MHIYNTTIFFLSFHLLVARRDQNKPDFNVVFLIKRFNKKMNYFKVNRHLILWMDMVILTKLNDPK